MPESQCSCLIRSPGLPPSTWIDKAPTQVAAVPTCSTLSRRSSSCSCCRGVTGWSARRTSDVGAVSRPSCRRRSCCCSQAENRDPAVQTAPSAQPILRTDCVPAVSAAAAARRKVESTNILPCLWQGTCIPKCLPEAGCCCVPRQLKQHDSSLWPHASPPLAASALAFPALLSIPISAGSAVSPSCSSRDWLLASNVSSTVSCAPLGSFDCDEPFCGPWLPLVLASPPRLLVPPLPPLLESLRRTLSCSNAFNSSPGGRAWGHWGRSQAGLSPKGWRRQG